MFEYTGTADDEMYKDYVIFCKLTDTWRTTVKEGDTVIFICYHDIPNINELKEQGIYTILYCT